MTESTVSKAVATQTEQRQTGPATLVRQYRGDFADVLPSHIKPDTFVRVAAGALKKGERDKRTGITKLEQAAVNNTAAFLSALLDAARLGLEPGTEQYYLTPCKNKNNGNREEILGIVGYQGYIELMYRAGAISSVVVEVVREHDKFNYSPGRMERPEHEIDWDAEDRGKLRLVYSYALMKDGSTSKVVVLNRAKIEQIKRSSQGAGSDYSPWKVHEEAMWMKSAVRQLAKWVPTSAEYITAQRRAELAAQDQPAALGAAGWIEQEPPGVVDGEVVDNEAYEEWAREQDTTETRLLPGDPDLTAHEGESPS